MLFKPFLSKTLRLKLSRSTKLPSLFFRIPIKLLFEDIKILYQSISNVIFFINDKLRKMKIKSIHLLFLLIILLISITSGLLLAKYLAKSQSPISLNFTQIKPSPTPLPLLKYSIINLKNYPFQSSQIKIEQLLNEEKDFNTYLFSYLSQGKKITGQLNLPNSEIKGIIIMIRGYVPPEIYQTGVGTKNAAAVLANNGYLTLAPDFLGFGGSDAESEDSWEARFVKPINVIELINSINSSRVITDSVDIEIPDQVQNDKLGSYPIGLWAHSNGGQVALTVLEVLSEPIPTTLWAPVTAPFPYSVMFYSDEMEDEGKATRKWVSLFEANYDVFDFSLTKHLNLLTGPLQIHQGTIDDAAPVAWNDEFTDKITAENTRREELVDELKTATDSAKIEQINSQILDPIELS